MAALHILHIFAVMASVGWTSPKDCDGQPRVEVANTSSLMTNEVNTTDTTFHQVQPSTLHEAGTHQTAETAPIEVTLEGNRNDRECEGDDQDQDPDGRRVRYPEAAHDYTISWKFTAQGMNSRGDEPAGDEPGQDQYGRRVQDPGGLPDYTIHQQTTVAGNDQGQEEHAEDGLDQALDGQQVPDTPGDQEGSDPRREPAHRKQRILLAIAGRECQWYHSAVARLQRLRAQGRGQEPMWLGVLQRIRYRGQEGYYRWCQQYLRRLRDEFARF